LCQTDNIIFSFDGDNAGRKAARRVLEPCLHYATDNRVIKFIFLPQEHDPDSFIRTAGAEAFDELIHNATPLSQFLLNEVTADISLSTPEGRARAQHNAKNFIQLMPPSSLRFQIICGLSQLTKSTPHEIERLFRLVNPVNAARTTVAPSTNRPSPIDLERKIVFLIAVHPTLSSELDDTALEILTTHFKEDNVETLIHLITVCRTMDKEANFLTTIERLQENEEYFKSLIAEIKARSGSKISDARSELVSAIRQIKMRVFKEKLNEMAESGLDDREACDRYRELMKKQKELRSQVEVSKI
jgi:DNA primase